MKSILVLASASPARRSLLSAAGIDAEVVVSGVDESAVEADSPEALCAVLARMKALAVTHELKALAVTHELKALGVTHELKALGVTQEPKALAVTHEPNCRKDLVLGCDSVLAFDGQILGKPQSAPEAVQRWRAMRGRSGVLHTGHCLVDLASERTAEGVSSTVVHFASLSDEEIESYVDSGEPLHVAGAFTIDGRGAPFVERIEGDHGTVVGLSLPLLRHLLHDLDRSITDLWRTS